MKHIAMLIPFLFACGTDGSTSTDPTGTTREVVSIANPIDDDFLTDYKWTGQEGTNTIIVTAESGWNDDGEKDETLPKMFHLYYCSGLDSETGFCAGDGQLFFATGEIEGVETQVCFSDIRFWVLPPEDFFIEVASNVDGDMTGKDVCLEAKRDTTYPDDLLLVKTNDQWLTFEKQELDW